ncbi:uncharacterized protein LOC142339652 [Convolutriloba macropyga]|uniref:uncharacterized protein LOC142339652 n=1 Tax=Convolutriloba macropyga TaxID=536237 RepID=UPI003F5259F2
MCAFANSGGMVDCSNIARQKSTSGTTLSNYNCASEEEKARTTYSESLFRWADGHLSEKVSTKERNIWAIFGALVTMILTLDRLLATIKRYKATNAAKHIKKVKKKKRQGKSQKAQTANLAEKEENGNLLGSDNNQSPNNMPKERRISDAEVHNDTNNHDDPHSSQSDRNNSQFNSAQVSTAV